MQQRNDIVGLCLARGDDAWSGMLAEPNEQRSDGPFLTIKRLNLQFERLRERRDGFPHLSL